MLNDLMVLDDPGKPAQNEAIEGQPPPPSPVVSLNDLTRYIDIQNQAIKSLPSGVIIPVASRSPWEDFRQEFWGNDLEKSETVDRGEDPVEDNVLPEGPPSGSFPVIEAPKSMPNALGLTSKKIVVRSEYDEAERAAVLCVKSGIKLFIATGTRGIGIIPFLTVDRRQ